MSADWEFGDNVTVATLGEEGVISMLNAIMTDGDDSVLLSIGDDCAAFDPAGALVLTSVDSMVEGQHFRKPWLTPSEAGRRLYRVAASDVLAMGGTPRWMVLSLSLPQGLTRGALKAFFGSFERACAKHKCSWIGGNITRADQLGFHLTVMGVRNSQGLLWTRSGAQPGDVLWVSGYPGRSAAGLSLLLDGNEDQALEPLRSSWREPRDLHDFARLTLETHPVHACMDLSDGLLMDASRMARASNVQCIVDFDPAVIPEDVARASRALGTSAIEWTLAGGESYELLFASPTPPTQELVARGAMVVGRVESRNEESDPHLLIDGECLAFGDSIELGWDPFQEKDESSPR